MASAYFDHNATTPLDPRVLEAMLPWLGGLHGNPSSAHGFGQRAREAVEQARDRVARLLGAAPGEIVFTASGTEANNAVILGRARSCGYRGRLVMSALEHPSVEEAVALAEAGGMEAERVAPSLAGRVDAEAMLRAVTPETRLVCLMLANNELGTLQPVAEVAAGCRRLGVPLLCDAVQAVGKVAVDVGGLDADFVTLGAHKFYGPLGAAALWVRPGAPFLPLLVGGSQERRRRAGTENVAALVGLGRAAELAAAELEARGARTGMLRDRFERGLAAIGDVRIHGDRVPRLPNTSHVAFLGVDAGALMIRLDLAGFAVSTGSACASGTVEPSGLLTAMGLPPEESSSSLRVSFGPGNTAAEVDSFLGALAREVQELRRVSERAP